MGVVGYEKRIEIIKRMLLEDKTHEEIAEVCDVHRVTFTKLASASHLKFSVTFLGDEVGETPPRSHDRDPLRDRLNHRCIDNASIPKLL